MATLTFYPDAHPETYTVDGYIYRFDNTGPSFDSLRTGAGTTASDTSTYSSFAARLTAHASVTDGYTYMARSMFLFKTDILFGVAPSAGTLLIYGQAGNNSFGGQLCLCSANPSSNTDLTTGDYDYTKFGTTDLAARLGLTGMNVTFTLNASGLANINTTGVSKFGVRLSWDMDNTAPTWSASGEDSKPLYFADYTGTSADPKLTLTVNLPWVFYDAASQPADAGSSTATQITITPPSSMANGDLVIVTCSALETGLTWSNGVAGGQTWNALTANNGQQSSRIFWAEFNGTWGASPRFDVTGSPTATQAIMHVFRPISGTGWSVDTTQVNSSYSAAGTPFDVTITGITTTNNNALVLAAWLSKDDNTWALQTSGWANPKQAQYRVTNA